MDNVDKLEGCYTRMRRAACNRQHAYNYSEMCSVVTDKINKNVWIKAPAGLE